MTPLHYYILVASIIFGFFSLVWKTTSVLNIFIKLAMLVMTIIGIVLVVKG